MFCNAPVARAANAEGTTSQVVGSCLVRGDSDNDSYTPITSASRFPVLTLLLGFVTASISDWLRALWQQQSCLSTERRLSSAPPIRGNDDSWPRRKLPFPRSTARTLFQHQDEPQPPSLEPQFRISPPWWCRSTASHSSDRRCWTSSPTPAQDRRPGRPCQCLHSWRVSERARWQGHWLLSRGPELV